MGLLDWLKTGHRKVDVDRIGRRMAEKAAEALPELDYEPAGLVFERGAHVRHKALRTMSWEIQW